jgi:RNA polymerase sporulation-specific sigma factor
MSRLEELIQRSQQGDREASELLVEENSGLIWSVAKRFLGRGTEADDLYQLGCLGFLKAVEGFDLSFGTQFSTYAVPKIAGEIRRFLRDDGAVKVSRGLKEQAATIKATRNRLTNALGREPMIQEISRQTGFSPEEIALAETATAATESIQRETGEEGFSLEDVLTDTESEERMVERIALRQAIARLPEREGMVIKLRYFHSLTQERVARVLQVSQVQVSRIEKKAIAMLRELMI